MTQADCNDLHDELVRRHYAAIDHPRATSRSWRRFASTPGRVSIASRRTQLRRYHVYLLEERQARRGDGGHPDLLRSGSSACASCKRRDMKEDLPYPKRPATAAGRAQPRRSPAAHRRREESLSPHAAADAVRRGPAAQRAVPAQSPRHRQPAHGAARRAGQGRPRSRDPAQSRRCSRPCGSTAAGCGRRPISSPARGTAGAPTRRSRRR